MRGRKIETKNEYLQLICILGHPHKLKVEFFQRWTQDYSQSYLLPIGVGITEYCKIIQVDNNKAKLILRSLSSEKSFERNRHYQYRGASGAIITFDKGERTSFDKVREVFKEFRQYTPILSIPIALIGFITSSKEIITTKEGYTLAKELEVEYYELKPRESKPEEVEKIFQDLFRRGLEIRDGEREFSNNEREKNSKCSIKYEKNSEGQTRKDTPI